MIVDSPSFPIPGMRSLPMSMPGMIVDSPSFQARATGSSAPASPLPSDSAAEHPTSALMSEVKESISNGRGPSAATGEVKQKKVSRFKMERT